MQNLYNVKTIDFKSTFPKKKNEIIEVRLPVTKIDSSY